MRDGVEALAFGITETQPALKPCKQEGPQTTRPSFIAITAFFLPPHLQSSACGRCSWRRLGVNNQGYGAARNLGQP